MNSSIPRPPLSSMKWRVFTKHLLNTWPLWDDLQEIAEFYEIASVTCRWHPEQTISHLLKDGIWYLLVYPCAWSHLSPPQTLWNGYHQHSHLMDVWQNWGLESVNALPRSPLLAWGRGPGFVLCKAASKPHPPCRSKPVVKTSGGRGSS